MPGKQRPTPVPLTIPRDVVVREVRAKHRRFLADVSNSGLPGGGQEKPLKPRQMAQEIFTLSRQPETLCSINEGGMIEVGQTALVCFVGAQQTILLRIFYRRGAESWVMYEYAFCMQERGQSAYRWVNAKEYFAAKPAQAVVDPASLVPTVPLMRAAAEELLEALKAGRRSLRAKGAQLTGDEVEHQIKGLNQVQFVLGADNAARLPVGAYKAACFKAGDAFKLRVFRRSTDGWIYGTFVLEVGPKEPGRRARSRGATSSEIVHQWKRS